MKGELTPKQERFVAEYLTDLNATQAAIRSGYSPRTAGVVGYENLKKPQIAAAIAKRQAKRADKLEITADRVLLELARLAFCDLRKLYREDGSLKCPDEWDDDTAAAVAGVEITEEFAGRGEARVFTGYTKRVRVFDKNSALEKAAKHLGLYEKDNAQRDSLVDLILSAIKKRAEAELGQVIEATPRLEQR